MEDKKVNCQEVITISFHLHSHHNRSKHILKQKILFNLNYGFCLQNRQFMKSNKFSKNSTNSIANLTNSHWNLACNGFKIVIVWCILWIIFIYLFEAIGQFCAWKSFLQKCTCISVLSKVCVRKIANNNKECLWSVL